MVEKLSVAVELLVFTIENDALKILMVERSEEPFANMPALPGVFVGINETLDEAAVRGIREEAGLDVEPVKLVAAMSNRKHNNPKSYFYITRFFMLCEVKGGQFEANEETSEARYFDVDDLPSDLNDHKSSEAQIRLCLDAWRDRSLPPVID